jgi:hypothetical protein
MGALNFVCTCRYILVLSTHVFTLDVLYLQIVYKLNDWKILRRWNMCCKVMPAWTILLFYYNHIYWCILPYVYYCSCNSRPQGTGHGNTSKNSVTRSCSLRWWSGLGVAFKATSSWWWIICTLLATLHCITQTLKQAVSRSRRPNITWRV